MADRAGTLILIAAATLLTLGVVMVNSAGFTIGDGGQTTITDILLGRQAAMALLAMVAMVAGSLVPIGRLGRGHASVAAVLWTVAAIVGTLLLVHVPGIGREINGARRWVSVGPIGFQPSEVAKWGIPFILAWHAGRQGQAMGRFIRGFGLPVALLLLVCALIATEDLGTAVLIGAVGVGLLLAAGARWWHVGMLAPLGAAGFLAALLHSPYRIDRLRAFLDPYQDPQGIGYHMLQSMAAVSGGGLAGRGLGNSIQKFGYLPEDTTDFIFAIICEELGIAGAAILVSLYVAILGCGWSIMRRCRDTFTRLLSLGIVLTIGLQALINLAVVSGLGPTKGIALPLVSAGGTGWVLTAFSLGILVAIDRETAQPGSPLAEGTPCRIAPQAR